MSPLAAKLGRDLWRIKGQAAAIALVIAIGVMMQVMMAGLVASLGQTRDAYYQRYRLAQVFAPVARAPEALRADLAAIPGVAQVETRLVGAGRVELAGHPLPIAARLLSLPDLGPPRLNALYPIAGRALTPGAVDEALLLDSFAAAHGLQAGQSLSVTLNGHRRDLRIAGLVKSPEFLYISAPGELIPDDARFAVLWMSRSALAANFDLKGAFNEALFSLTREAKLPAVLAATDRLLEPYGAQGAYGLEDQFSNRFVAEEIKGLEVSALVVPPIFLLIAAFLLYIVVSRMVQAERQEIGLMKAFGYSNLEVGWHYMQLVLAIAFGGALLGCGLGIWAGQSLIGLYTQYYKFPFLVFRLEPSAFVIGIAAALGSAAAGSLFVLRRLVRLVPAEAMRPPAPADYSRSGRWADGLARSMDQLSRMVLRRLLRQPWRMAGAVLGIASGMGLTLAMLTIYAGFERALDLSFAVVDRSDASVAFLGPQSPAALTALARLPGVWQVEPQRHLPVVLRNGRYSHKSSLTGLLPDARLLRVVDDKGRQQALPGAGLVIAKPLAKILNIAPGQSLRVEVREGARPVLTIPVVGLAESLLGAPVYINLEALNRRLGQPGHINAAALEIEPGQEQGVYQRLKDMPRIAGVSLQSDTRRAFETLMNEGAGAMRFVMGFMAFVITFGIVYNAARVSQAERARDLASLQILGYSHGEVAYVLLGELAAITLLAIPLGSLIGHLLSFAIAEGFSTELYQVPARFIPSTHGNAALTVLAASAVSGWLVQRGLAKRDLTAALKSRE
jgi:putative ABC transport system permease protein